MGAEACLLFGLLTNTVTSLWVYIGRDWDFSVLAYAMYFPTILSLLFVSNIKEFIIQIIGLDQIFSAVQYSVVSIVAVVVMIYACYYLDILMEWGIKDTAVSKSPVHGHNSRMLSGFLRAAGEEVGWRCYLLPCLVSSVDPGYALFISGIMWGLFHVAVMILLTRRLSPPHPNVTIFVQALSCVISAFPHGWVAIKSGYSVWAAAMMHFSWNQINPRILGSIYTQTPGRLRGPQWLINGEGLAGCIVMIPVAILVIWDLEIGLT